jgi:DNA-binding transcriptional LysR family regulator
VKLLNRTTRRVTVTADGAAYYERVPRLLADLDDIEASSASARHARAGACAWMWAAPSRGC